MSQQATGPGPGRSAPSPQAAAPTPRQVTRHRHRSTAAVGVLLVLAAAAVGQVLVGALGPDTLFVVGLLALVPLVIVLTALAWIDRWDAEPRRWRAFAVLWGAGVSVFGTLVLGEVFMAAAGFAFTENILYFGAAYTEAGWGPDLAITFVLRGLSSPFAHVLFTVWTGFFLGVAAHRAGRVQSRRWARGGVSPAGSA